MQNNQANYPRQHEQLIVYLSDLGKKLLLYLQTGKVQFMVTKKGQELLHCSIGATVSENFLAWDKIVIIATVKFSRFSKVCPWKWLNWQKYTQERRKQLNRWTMSSVLSSFRILCQNGTLRATDPVAKISIEVHSLGRQGRISRRGTSKRR